MNESQFSLMSENKFLVKIKHKKLSKETEEGGLLDWNSRRNVLQMRDIVEHYLQNMSKGNQIMQKFPTSFKDECHTPLLLLKHEQSFGLQYVFLCRLLGTMSKVSINFENLIKFKV